MGKSTEFRKHCTVGEYSFDLCVNRDVVLDTLRVNEKFWTAMNKATKDKKGVEDVDLDDINEVIKIMAINDEMEEETPAVVSYILPKMLALADDETNPDELIKYCEENEVDDLFFEEVIKFMMLGFTKGKAEKKPKVNVNFS